MVFERAVAEIDAVDPSDVPVMMVRNRFIFDYGDHFCGFILIREGKVVVDRH